jgi:hypothetical protein
MMSRILVAFLAMAMAQCSVSWGTEPYQPYGYGTAFDPFAAPPPSGLRFSGMDTTIRTGGPVGDPGAAWGGGPCSSCGGGDTGLCIDWKLVGWYGSWEGHHHKGYGYGGGGYGCKKACRSCGGCW